MARPSKWSPEVEQRVLEALASGASRRAAAEYAGISPDSLARYVRRFAGFAASVRGAEARFEIRAALVVKDHIDKGDLKAAQWYLERRRPDDWGRRDRVDVVSTVRQLARDRGYTPDEAELAVREATRILREAEHGE